MFELGTRDSQDYWLEGHIVGDGEFLFNGRLFVPGIAQGGTVIDNFPKGPAPGGWTKRQLADSDGYELVSNGSVLFGYRVVPFPQGDVETHLCIVTANIYDSGGEVVAESLPDELRLYKGPAQIGRGGIRFA
jgi:hypothetical protein